MALKLTLPSWKPAAGAALAICCTFLSFSAPLSGVPGSAGESLIHGIVAEAAPSKPSGVVIKDTLDGDHSIVTISWSKASGAAGYRVLYQEQGDTKQSEFALTTGLAATNKGNARVVLKSQTTYIFYVKSYYYNVSIRKLVYSSPTVVKFTTSHKKNQLKNMKATIIGPKYKQVSASKKEKSSILFLKAAGIEGAADGTTGNAAADAANGTTGTAAADAKDGTAGNAAADAANGTPETAAEGAADGTLGNSAADAANGTPENVTGDSKDGTSETAAEDSKDGTPETAAKDAADNGSADEASVSKSLPQVIYTFKLKWKAVKGISVKKCVLYDADTDKKISSSVYRFKETKEGAKSTKFKLKYKAKKGSYHVPESIRCVVKDSLGDSYEILIDDVPQPDET